VEKEIKQCGLCARWTHDGDDVPSGNRNPRTGETPYDNFICDQCQREARVLCEVNRGCIDTNDGGKLLEIVAGRQETPFRVRQRGRFDCGRIGRTG
jgi:hypothetical protein